MDLVTYLNEFPRRFWAKFDPAFLDLPTRFLSRSCGASEILRAGGKGGTLAPNFLAIINLDKDRAGAIRAGHERVLRARFADARFLGDGSEMSARRLFAEIGSGHLPAEARSYGDKVSAMRTLARWIAEQWFASSIPQASVASADRAAELPSATWSPTWSVSSPSCRGSSEACTQKAQGEPEDVAGPYTITTSPRRSMIPFRETLRAKPSRSRTSSTLWWAASRWGWSRPGRATHSRCAARPWES